MELKNELIPRIRRDPVHQTWVPSPDPVLVHLYINQISRYIHKHWKSDLRQTTYVFKKVIICFFFQDSSLGLLKPVSPSYSANPVSPTISMHSNSSYDDRRFDQDRLTVRESGVGMKRWNSDVNRNHQVI